MIKTEKYVKRSMAELEKYLSMSPKRVRRSSIDANLQLLDNVARIYDNELLMLKYRIDKWWAGIK